MFTNICGTSKQFTIDSLCGYKTSIFWTVPDICSHNVKSTHTDSQLATWLLSMFSMPNTLFQTVPFTSYHHLKAHCFQSLNCSLTVCVDSVASGDRCWLVATGRSGTRRVNNIVHWSLCRQAVAGREACGGRRSVIYIIATTTR